MKKTLVKVYAVLGPTDAACREAVRRAGADALGNEDDPWLEAPEGQDLRIVFEGVYFPLEDVLAALERHLSPHARGKLDYLDLEDWILTRHIWENGTHTVATRSLNQVLEYSGY